jgi:hemerythrin-like domain-containing protein
MKKSSASTNPIEMLKEDHSNVKKLFERFEKSHSESERKKIAFQALSELKTHASLEEEIFYPAARAGIGEDELMNEAEEEHHVAHVLIEELESMNPGDPRFEAKFMVLAESVRHHIKEEESEMLPKVKKSDVDLESIGVQMRERKSSLQRAAA